jgi:hypothetical protein
LVSALVLVSVSVWALVLALGLVSGTLEALALVLVSVWVWALVWALVSGTLEALASASGQELVSASASV